MEVLAFDERRTAGPPRIPLQAEEGACLGGGTRPIYILGGVVSWRCKEGGRLKWENGSLASNGAAVTLDRRLRSENASIGIFTWAFGVQTVIQGCLNLSLMCPP